MTLLKLESLHSFTERWVQEMHSLAKGVRRESYIIYKHTVLDSEYN